MLVSIDSGVNVMGGCGVVCVVKQNKRQSRTKRAGAGCRGERERERESER